MSELRVHGGKPLQGEVTPSGNKNSVLPLLCASLLTDERVTLRNVPYITDVEKLVGFFEKNGSKVEWDREKRVLNLEHAGFATAPETLLLPEGMRSSVLLFAPLLNRLGAVRVMSGAKGCALGVREIDPHIGNLRAFGAHATPDDPGLLRAPGRLKGVRRWQDYMSVTATESFAMAAVLAEGPSVLINAASEPHVQDVCRFLAEMGAIIDGLGTSRLEIEGVDRLKGADFEVPPDYHEVTTFLALGAVTGGDVRVTEAVHDHYDLILASFAKLGVIVEPLPGGGFRVGPGQQLLIEQPFTPNLLAKIEAAPWPYFPVDLLPVMVALATRCEGAIQFWNKIYEGGFAWLPELVKFGAHAVVSDPHRVIVFGNRPMRPAVVESPYIIRAAVALFMLAASIPGHSVVKNADPIKRAHPFFVENLRKLGAEVDWA